MLFVLAAAEPTNPYAPWGTHLAFGNDPTTDMSVMWSTRLPPASAVVDVTLAATGATTRFPASSRVFSDANNTQTLHRAFMTGLAPGGHYTYVVGDGSAGNSSATFSFALHPVEGGSWADNRDYPVLTIYGDMGVAANSHKTLPLLYRDAASGSMDVVLHVGDIAYDLQSNSGASGDAFVQEVEPFAANMPVHFCPGNHEDCALISLRSRHHTGRASSPAPSLLTHTPHTSLPPLLPSRPHVSQGRTLASTARGST